ncbi:Hypothetical predicted protein [Paramuricea clavata]|uniref:Uncharacterized protein n=1 Tax=Paramuricea clavata TaxID=317549 RepID=A0A6S7IMA1_PARCT|nr:Hypothetical predicted protein [Paramuricea clavata]
MDGAAIFSNLGLDPLAPGNGDGDFHREAEVNQKQENRSSINNADGKTLTVVFHAILSKKFELGDRIIVIRGDEPVFAGGWDGRGVPVIQEGHFDKQLLLRGEIKIPLRLASRRCGYKYVLLDKRNEATHEELVEFKSRGGILDRCLVIGEEYVAEKSKLTE